MIVKLTSVLGFTLIPVAAAIIGAVISALRPPGAMVTAAVQHFAAGVVFAAAAGELMPDLMHRQSVAGTIIGGAAGVVVMLFIKAAGARATGALALLVTVAVDIFIDGLVLGIGFGAGPREGRLLTIALTTEVLFLGLSIAPSLGRGSRARVIATTSTIALLLPVGAAMGIPLALLSQPLLAGFFAFGLIALLYLVTEELLVEAHALPERPWVTAMLFVGFLSMLLVEEFAS